MDYRGPLVLEAHLGSQSHLSSRRLGDTAHLQFLVALFDQHLNRLHLVLLNQPLKVLRIKVKVTFIIIGFLPR